ncbi:MAG TPA: hypothetical protein VGC40_07620 [Paenirhodobacter sp.]
MRINSAILTVATAFFIIGATPAVMAQQPAAQGQKVQPCTGSKQACTKNVTQQTSGKAKAPHVGDSARKASTLQQAKNSRLPTLPKNQHYRIMDDRVVRVDDKTMKVVAILGLSKDLLK